ncbi:MAG TPA: putative PEP-binding protein, partial [Gammaproteobacteria bacterium]|nr:putative PEP-binding protein [Gammaproteobacteria bacterium]
RANSGLNNLRILLPMISGIHEVDESLRLVRQAYCEVVEEGALTEFPPVGVMIEVPSSVYQAASIAKRVDFLSIGTNDLTQYLLAVDRNNNHVANLYDCLHPAVLCALKMVVDACKKLGKPVSICGEMAGDPPSVIALLGLGFDMLSMNATNLPKIKWIIRNFTFEKAKLILQECLMMENAIDVRLKLESVLEEAGLGGLVRAGK